MDQEQLIYTIGLTIIPGIGHITAKKLISFCGSAEAVFREKKRNLLRIPGIGAVLSEYITTQNVLQVAERELGFIDRFRIGCKYFQDEDYPYRLKQCIDSPVLLYYKGNADLNTEKVLSIVGTRSATGYGRAVCEELIRDLADTGVLIVSGLAYGIDTCSHKEALAKGLKTIGVLAHGLDRIYPGQNKRLAEKMLRQGGLLTDFISGTKPDRENFPSRNRIIAGLSDATIVVEAAVSGGALITADIANSYNRDVYAVPGRWNDELSAGCNSLIRTNRAALIQSATDLKFMLGWEKDAAAKAPKQTELFVNLSPDEEVIVRILRENGVCGIDLLVMVSGLGSGKVATALLNLEMQTIIKGLPGKRYMFNR
jgi:DNA processing protein